MTSEVSTDEDTTFSFFFSGDDLTAVHHGWISGTKRPALTAGSRETSRRVASVSASKTSTPRSSPMPLRSARRRSACRRGAVRRDASRARAASFDAGRHVRGPTRSAVQQHERVRHHRVARAASPRGRGSRPTTLRVRTSGTGPRAGASTRSRDRPSASRARGRWCRSRARTIAERGVVAERPGGVHPPASNMRRMFARWPVWIESVCALRSGVHGGPAAQEREEVQARRGRGPLRFPAAFRGERGGDGQHERDETGAAKHGHATAPPCASGGIDDAQVIPFPPPRTTAAFPAARPLRSCSMPRHDPRRPTAAPDRSARRPARPVRRDRVRVRELRAPLWYDELYTQAAVVRPWTRSCA